MKRGLTPNEMGPLSAPMHRLQVPCMPGTAVCFLCAFAAVLLLGVLAEAQAHSSSEDEVKAAMLFNFGKFVEWPESAFENPQASIVFGSIGDQRLGFYLQRVASGEKVQGRSIVIRNQRFGDDLRRCHVLFIGASERKHVPQILASLRDENVLTVSDVEGFADGGGMVEIVIEGDQARFVVNLDVARQSGLRVSAKVLAMARVISHNQAAR